MKHLPKKLFLGGLIGCMIIIAVVYFIIHPKTENSVVNQTLQGTTNRVQNSIKEIPKLFSDDADPWKVWIQKQADLWVKLSADQLKKKDIIWTEESLRESMVSYLTQNLEMFKKASDIPPDLDHTVPTLKTKWNTTGKKYDGPQTPAGLIEAFHSDYADEILDSWAARHPPEDFLQMLLNRGITIINFSEYSGYMNAWSIGFILENNPEMQEMSASEHEIPESDLEALTAASTEAMIARIQRSSMASRAEQNIRGGLHIGENYYPYYTDRKITYVKYRKRLDGFSTSYFGQPLTEVQKFNLAFRGVEPVGTEVVYIDAMGNRLEEKPDTVTREEFRKMMTEGEAPPPEEWWDPEAPVPDTDDYKEYLPPENTEPDPRLQSTMEEAKRQVEDAAQAELKKFIQKVRQLEKFATMSDADIATELEKQLRQQLLPELPTEENLEEVLRALITPKPLTSKRFEKAIQTLERHGPKEGLRRLAKDDPELAEYFRKNPQTVPPKRSQPANSQKD